MLLIFMLEILRLSQASSNTFSMIKLTLERGTYSGDTLIDFKDDDKIILQGVTVPPPVFIASVEYESLKDKVAFDDVRIFSLLNLNKL